MPDELILHPVDFDLDSFHVHIPCLAAWELERSKAPPA